MNSTKKCFDAIRRGWFVPAIAFSILSTFSSGCIQDEICNSKIQLSNKVDELLSCEESEWVESKGRFYYAISNGAIRVKSDGEISLIIDLENGGHAIIPVTYSDSSRAARVSMRFGVSKVTGSVISNSMELQLELLNSATDSISNKMASFVTFEAEETPK